MQENTKHWDTIGLSTMQVQCLLGFSREERLHRQRVDVNLELHLDSTVSTRSAHLSDTIDYVRVLGDTRFILESGEFILIETAAEAIASYLVAPHPVGYPANVLKAVTLTLTKPRVIIYEAVPRYRAHREVRSQVEGVREFSAGRVETLFAGKEAALYRWVLSPGQTLGREGKASEMVLSQSLKVGGRRVQPGAVFEWEAGTPRVYSNSSSEPQVVLCVDRFPDWESRLQCPLDQMSDTAWVVPRDFYLGIPASYID